MATQNNASRRPTHYVYAVSKRGDDEKGFWTRIGAAWPNGDGKGWSLKIDLWPTNGSDIVMREPREDEAAK